MWGVKREDEFSPLKNSDSAGCDCPSTSRSAIFKQHRKWIELAGGIVMPTGDGQDIVACEVSPLVSYAGEVIQHCMKTYYYYLLLKIYSD